MLRPYRFFALATLLTLTLAARSGAVLLGASAAQDAQRFAVLEPSQGAPAELVLHRFAGIPDASGPRATLIADKYGTLYGTSVAGGDGKGGAGCNFGEGCGAVFKLTPAWSGYIQTVLHGFHAGKDGTSPTGSLISGERRPPLRNRRWWRRISV